MSADLAPPSYTQSVNSLKCALLPLYSSDARTLPRAPRAPAYIAIATWQGGCYLLRDDGVVDRSTGNGKVHQQMTPPTGTKYVAVTADSHASYLLLDNGVIHRTLGRGNVKLPRDAINPPPGVKYIRVSAGPVASYFLRSDGACDRSLHGGRVERCMPPPSGTRYVAVSAGQQSSYLLRSDGIVDQVRGGVVRTSLPALGANHGAVPSAYASTIARHAQAAAAAAVLTSSSAAAAAVLTSSSTETHVSVATPAASTGHQYSSRADAVATGYKLALEGGCSVADASRYGESFALAAGANGSIVDKRTVPPEVPEANARVGQSGVSAADMVCARELSALLATTANDAAAASQSSNRDEGHARASTSNATANYPWESRAAAVAAGYALAVEGGSSTADATGQAEEFATEAVNRGFVAPVLVIAISDQFTMNDNHGTHSPYACYLVRSDGSCERKTFCLFGPDDRTIMHPPVGTRYIAASAADYASYLLRDDGVVVRTVSYGRVHVEMRPPAGVAYVGVAAGAQASYLLRSDGRVDRTVSKGRITCTIVPLTEDEFACRRPKSVLEQLRAFTNACSDELVDTLKTFDKLFTSPLKITSHT